MKHHAPRIILLVVLAAATAALFVWDLDRYLTLAHLKAHHRAFEQYYQAHAGLTLSLFFLGYVAVTALSLPAAAVMTLAGGALFGLGVGTVVVSFASTIGATLAFLVSRFLLRDAIQGRFGDRLAAINAGIRKEGAFYLFTLRLVPLFPFFIVNLAMGLTPIRTRVFYAVSQAGMLPGALLYVNAGTQLSRIESVGDILSPGLIASFALLGVFPLISRAAISFIQRRRGGGAARPSGERGAS